MKKERKNKKRTFRQRLTAFTLAAMMFILPCASDIGTALAAEADNLDTDLSEDDFENLDDVSGYTVTLSEAENGSLYFYDSKTKEEGTEKSYEKGDTVSLLFVPDDGYEVSSITVSDTQGNTLDSSETADDEFTFTMPAMDVVVSGVFAETGETGGETGDGADIVVPEGTLVIKGVYEGGSYSNPFAVGMQGYMNSIGIGKGSYRNTRSEGIEYCAQIPYNAFFYTIDSPKRGQGACFTALNEILAADSDRGKWHVEYGNVSFSSGQTITLKTGDILVYQNGANSWVVDADGNAVGVTTRYSLHLDYVYDIDSDGTIWVADCNGKSGSALKTRVTKLKYFLEDYSSVTVESTTHTYNQMSVLRAENPDKVYPFSITKKAASYTKNGVAVGTDNMVSAVTYTNGTRTWSGSSTYGDIAKKYSDCYEVPDAEGNLKSGEARFTAWERGDASHTPITVYYDEACTQEAVNGELLAGRTYYTKNIASVTVSETTNPVGWANYENGATEPYFVSNDMTEGVTTEFNFSDKFTGDPFALSLTKKGPSGNVIEGAYFTLTRTNATTGAKESWVYKTDAKGEIDFASTDYLYSGTVYLNSENKIQFFAGNYTLTETTAAPGYLTEGSYSIRTQSGQTIQTNTDFSGKVFDFVIKNEDDTDADGNRISYGRARAYLTVNDASGIRRVYLSNLSLDMTEDAVMCGFKLEPKKNSDMGASVAEGGADDLTITYALIYVGRYGDSNDSSTWYDKNGNGKQDTGEVFGKNETLYTFTVPSGQTAYSGYYDAGGNYVVSNNVLQAGIYRLVEVGTADGLTSDSKIDKNEIYIGGDSSSSTKWMNIIDGECLNAGSFSNGPKRGGVAGYKYDKDTMLPSAVSGSTFDGIEIYIRNDNAYSVMLDTDGDGIAKDDNTEVKPGATYKIYTLKDGESVFSTNPTLLPYGTYSILERQGTNKNYVIGDDLKETGLSFTINEDMEYWLFSLSENIEPLKQYVQTTYAAQIEEIKTHYSDYAKTVQRVLEFAQVGTGSESVLANEPARHGVAIVKYDTDDEAKAADSMTIVNTENGYPEPQGDAVLTGAVYQIINKNSGYIMVDTDGDHIGDTRVENGGVCATLTTAVDSVTNIEYGTYLILEDSSSAGYNNSIDRNGQTAKIVQVRGSETVNVTYDVSKLNNTLYENVIRGGFEFYKYDEESKMNIAFLLTNRESVKTSGKTLSIFIACAIISYQEGLLERDE